VETIEHTDEKGRKYKAYREGEMIVIVGPPEGLVDELGLLEPFATRLHNVLFRRGLWNYQEVRKQRNALLGAYQEALRLDVQKLTEGFFKYEHQEVQHE
jgi:hypothetical protein